ncbi:MAG TPA: glycosyl transferase [Bacteroidales bacterium]|nr:glycosyl transferase [Bacteroidales bacterium]
MEKKQQREQIVRFIIYFLILLPLMLQRDITPNNELKYLSIADEALRDGHFFTMYNHGETYADKPPLYIWIVMFFKWLLGSHNTFILALFSLIPSFVTLAIFNRWCSGELGKKYMIAAELALMTTAYFIGSAIVLRMDMLMTMFITLAMYTFWRIYKGDDRRRLRILFPVYIFLAIFSKGPVGIMIPLLCIPPFLLVEGKIRSIGRYWGWSTWLILALLCGGWWLGVWFEGGHDYLNNLLFHQTVDRAVDSFHHKAPFWYYAYTIWYAMGPWSLITIPVIIWALVKKMEMSSLVKFMLIVAASFLVIMSLISSKLAVYIMPIFTFLTYPAFILLRNCGKPRFAEGTRKVVTYGAATLLGFFLIAGFIIPRFNSRLGYKAVAHEALEVAQANSITRFGYYDLRSAENMDVFLGRSLEELSQEEFETPRTILAPNEGIIIFHKNENGVATFKTVK